MLSSSDESVSSHDLPAERAMLGALMISPERITDARDVVSPADMYRYGHGITYRTLLDLDASERPIDLLTVTATLRERGQLDDVGGPAYLAGLTDGVPRSANVGAYAAIVAARARERAAETVIAEALDAVRTSDPDALARLRARLDALDGDRPKTLKVMTGLDLVVAEDPPAIVADWPILIRSSITAVVGGSGAGKTHLALRMSVSVLKAGGRVLLAALEGVGGLRRRLLACCHAFGLEDEHLRHLVVVGALDLGDLASIGRAARAGGNVDLIVVDTLARALGDLDENSANAIGSALNGAQRLSEGCGGAAVLILHHPGKSNNAERGSGAFRAGVDVLGFLDDEGEQRVLRIEKMRDSETPGPRVFRLRAVPECGSVVLDDAANVLPAGSESELSPKVQDVLRELRTAGPCSAAELVQALHGRVGRTTVFGALGSLERIGLARQERGTWYASPAQSGQ
jgi:hypothetical protein